MKISISARDKYQACSMMYKLHYLDKIRPIRQSSALVFGSALDEALNHLLQHKDLEQAQSVFWMQWSEYEHKPIIDYFKSDLDLSLIPEAECAELDAIEDQTLRDHRANWLSMYYKGMKLLEVYNRDLLPKINKVIDIQKTITIKNESDDEITGIIDLVAEIDFNGQSVVAVLDNKSTSTPYPKNSVLTKHQTALYSVAEGIEYAGFLTMNKKDFRTQCIVDKVPEALQDEVLDSFVSVLDGIKSETFEKVPKNKCYMFGQKCAYYKLCWEDKMDGLVKKEDKKEVVADEE